LVKFIPISKLFFFSGIAIIILFLAQWWNKAMKNLGKENKVEEDKLTKEAI